MKLSIPLSLAAILVAAPGCSVTDRAFAFLGSEAGTDVVAEDFGVSTANNSAVMSGDLPSTLAAKLTGKFAREVPAVVNFAFNSSTLDASAQASLRQQAAWIIRHDKALFRIYGHTDKVGSESANKSLGQRRARAVANYLIALGVPAQKLQAVHSFGETKPVVLTNDRSRENRRAVTEVSGFGDSHASADLDGRYAVLVYQQYVSEPYVASATTANVE